KDSEIHLDAADPTRFGQGPSLRFDRRCGEHATATVELCTDPLEVARQLLDRVDRGDPLHLYRYPRALLVAAHEVDRPDVRRPFAANERQLLAERRRPRGELGLEIALDTILLKGHRFAHVVDRIAKDLRDSKLESILGLAPAFANDDEPLLLLDHGWWRHPVQRSETSGIVMDEEGPVGLEHEQANRLGQSRRQPTGVENFAAGHEQSHRRRTVLSSSDSWADGRATRTDVDVSQASPTRVPPAPRSAGSNFFRVRGVSARTTRPRAGTAATRGRARRAHPAHPPPHTPRARDRRPRGRSTRRVRARAGRRRRRGRRRPSRVAPPTNRARRPGDRAPPGRSRD